MNCQLDDDIYVPVASKRRENVFHRVRLWITNAVAFWLRPTKTTHV